MNSRTDGYRLRTVRRCLSAAAGLVLATASLLFAQTQATPKPPPTPPKAAPTPPPRELDGGWPRDYATKDGGAIRVYQPQIASWDGQRRMVMYSAVSYSAKGAAKPALGTVKIEADSTVAVADRLVNFTQVKLTEANFPGLPKEELSKVVETISDSVPE